MKKIQTCLSLLLLLIAVGTYAQAPTVGWQKSIGGSSVDDASSVTQTTDGGYIVVGYTESNDFDATGNHSNGDAWVIKFNASGAEVWRKTYGGADYDGLGSITQTSDGGYILAGSSYSTDGNYSSNHGDSDFWILKINATGDILWQKLLGGTGSDGANTIVQTSDGGYIVAGNSNSNDGDVSDNHGDNDYWVVKLNSTGGIVWQKSLGGSALDWNNSMAKTTDGGCIVVGFTQSSDINGDYYVVKLSATGSIEWQKALGGTGGDYAYAVVQTSDGGYLVAGDSNSSDGDVGVHTYPSYDYWIVKLSTTGAIQWGKLLGGSDFEQPYAILPTADGGYVIPGYTASNDEDVSGNHGGIDFWVVKINATGSLQWQKTVGGSGDDYPSSICLSTDGGYVMVGRSNSNDGDVSGNHGGDDAWVVKLVSPNSVFTRVKALLKGPLNGTTMSTTLNTNNLIPIAQPYSGAPWNYAGTSTESVTAIPTNVTDWVLVELRDATTPATVVATRAAFILSDGSIVDTDGSSPVEFKNMLAGNYHIAIRHRNHLAIRTATAQALGTTASGATLYDFTTAQSKANGTNPMVQSGTVYAMWSGDVNSDSNVYNTASPQDASQVVNGVANKTGNTFHLPSYGGYKSVYNVLDVNMDGNVYNTATPQDASNIVNNVANAPGNTFHLPSYSGLKAKL